MWGHARVREDRVNGRRARLGAHSLFDHNIALFVPKRQIILGKYGLAEDTFQREGALPAQGRIEALDAFGFHISAVPCEHPSLELLKRWRRDGQEIERLANAKPQTREKYAIGSNFGGIWRLSCAAIRCADVLFP